ncbi:MAG: hypothetical protein F4137_07820 [Acidobacteria bacterium]|nr:hypothetical protein [Acidobacteriota bacterium]MYH28750.1 hypothetical protein [Acidobacteriota bacterium]
MKLITMLPPQQQKLLRRLRKRLANRVHMRRVREARKLLCVGVDLPIEGGTCGRMVHAEAQRCIHCAKRRHWLLTHAMNQAEVAITSLLEDGEALRESDVIDDIPNPVPLLDDDLSDLGANQPRVGRAA